MKFQTIKNAFLSFTEKRKTRLRFFDDKLAYKYVRIVQLDPSKSKAQFSISFSFSQSRAKRLRPILVVGLVANRLGHGSLLLLF